MPLPTLTIPHALNIPVERLTPEAFAPFGTVIENPLHHIPPTASTLPPNATRANQNTATKLTDVSLLTNFYGSAASQKGGRALMSMFVCEPRVLRYSQVDGASNNARQDKDYANGGNVNSSAALFDVRILERHPYTSQTFIPLGLSPREASRTAYLVIVAPSTPSPAPSIVGVATTQTSALLRKFLPASLFRGSDTAHPALPTDPPDPYRLRAFLAHGGQAVTYGAGTWHAPMVVLGEREVEFVVVQFANGVAREDCEEVLLGVGAEDGQGRVEEWPVVELDSRWIREHAAKAKL